MLSINISELIWTVINFLLLLFLLRRFLYRPICRFMDARQARIDAGLEKERAAQDALRAEEARQDEEQQEARARAKSLLQQTETVTAEESREALVEGIMQRIKERLSKDFSPVPTVEGTEHPEPSFRSDNPVVRDVAKYFSPEVMPEVAALIEDLDLVPISIQRIEPTTDEDSN